MAEVIKMPRMSDTMEEGNIVAWHKEVGDEIEVGDLLAEIETDKATMDFESPADGILLHIAVAEGSIAIGGVLAIIGEKGEDVNAILAAQSNGATSTEAPAAKENNQAKDETPVVVENKEEAPITTHNKDQRIKASPLAKKMAEEAGLNLINITGSGDNGRIVKKDVESLLEKGIESTPVTTKPEKTTRLVVPSAPTSQGANYEDISLSQMRKVIAKRLGESKFSAPHFYLTVEINMDKAIQARKQLNEIAPTKISFNDIVLKAAAAALQQHPNINSSWLGDRIRRNHDINIGVAVAVGEGLLVPVIHHANTKTLSQINTQVRELAGKAKDRKLQPQEMQGNTFTISNLGMFGIEEFTAIINPPDACILAVGSIIQKPIVKDGEMQIGNMMKVTLSCDHRVVDGATGAQFLKTFKGILENPIAMLV